MLIYHGQFPIMSTIKQYISQIMVHVVKLLVLIFSGFFALLIMMYPPFDPGTLPSTTSRFSSLSTPSIRRLRIVIRTSPIWPDIRLPVNTRDGNADEPIDPVI